MQCMLQDSLLNLQSSLTLFQMSKSVGAQHGTFLYPGSGVHHTVDLSLSGDIPLPQLIMVSLTKFQHYTESR